MFPYNDLREFISELDKQGQLKRISAQVDWNLELAAIMRKVLDNSGPAILFENIKGYSPEFPFFSGTLGTYGRYALAMGLSPTVNVHEITKVYRQRVKTPIKPVMVDKKNAPCKENILTGKEINLDKFPTPFWHVRDGGRYMGTFHCVVAKDTDTGWVNVGIYRMVIHDKDHLGILFQPGRHAEAVYKKYEQQGKAMPIAISIGQDPINFIAAYGRFEAQVSEWDMAGALRTKPVQLTKCETVDLEVPATAEIVIEGEVPPFERREEGPFGEYTGYYGGTRAPRPFVNVTCITHRNNPIHTGLMEGKPIQENNILASVENTAAVEDLLMDRLNLDVKAVFDHPWSGVHGVVVSLKPRYPGHVQRIAHAIWGSEVGYHLDYIFAVDDDIDPTNLNEVLWAICTRCKPDRDIHIYRREQASALWPCLLPEEREAGIGARALIDATFPAEWPREWVPIVSDWWDFPEEIRKQVDSRWQKLGF